MPSARVSKYRNQTTKVVSLSLIQIKDVAALFQMVPASELTSWRSRSMAKRERLGLAVGTAAIAFVLACNPTSAQPGPRGPSSDNIGWGPGMMMGPGMMGPGGFGFMCNPRAAGFAEWRMQRIESAVRPTEAQRPALNELRNA